jgi:hypothetical protein
MSISDFENLTGTKIISPWHAFTSKTLFVLLDLVNMQIMMTGKQNREWQDKRDGLELSFAVLPHILLK